MHHKRKKLRKFFRIRTQRMLTENQVGEILSRRSRGEGKKRIARAMGISKTTVSKYLHMSDAQTDRARCHQHMNRACRLDKVKGFIEEKFWVVEGNCRNLQELLLSERGIQVSLRTLEWYCQNKLDVRRAFNLANNAQVKHPNRIETGPGQEAQIDFGEKEILIDNEPRTVHFFTATLGYSRRIYAAFFFCETQEAWLCGLERAFRYFNGIPRTVVCDNAKALVYKPREHGKPPVYTDSFKALCHYWGTRPVACAPYTPQHKGKVERSVEYLKDSFLKDFRQFKSLEDMRQKFEIWENTVASNRMMMTADAQPIRFTPKSRFAKEAAAMIPYAKRPVSDYQCATRKVDAAGHISVGRRLYGISAEYGNKIVDVLIGSTKIIVSFQGKTVMRLDRDCDACSPVGRLLPDEQAGVVTTGKEFPASPMDRDLQWYSDVIADFESAAHGRILQ